MAKKENRGIKNNLSEIYPTRTGPTKNKRYAETIRVKMLVAAHPVFNPWTASP